MSGQYEDRYTTFICVSQNENSLVALQKFLEELGIKNSKYNAERDKYIEDNMCRCDAAPKKPLLSKDHLPLTAGQQRFEINQCNSAIDRENYNARNLVYQEILKEADSHCESMISFSEEEEKFLGKLSEEYYIEEIMEIKKE